MEIAGYIALFFVGLTLGMLGSGGSILSVPVLVYLFSMDAVMASAYSLFIVGTTSLVGTVMKYKAEMVSVRMGLSFGMPSLLIIFSTRKWLIPAIPDIIIQTEWIVLSKRHLILGLFSILMVLAALATIYRRDNDRPDGKAQPVIFVALAGSVTGLLTGMVGAGGGFLIIPALVYLTGLPFKTAVGTTLFIITFNSLFGFMGDMLNYSLDWRFLFLITLLAVSGIIVGAGSAKKIPAHRLQKLFSWFILCMGTFIFVRELLTF